ncbi:hypothetical protein B0H19DRAFT_1202232 [Mycena capillaripes]|nr:hypothetical protein B0H19DRAFT_1202232 [Mycena capillaripes]
MDSRKFCASGWSFLPIRRIDSTTSETSIMKPLGTGSCVMTDSSNGRPHPALYELKESLVLERVY